MLALLLALLLACASPSVVPGSSVTSLPEPELPSQDDVTALALPAALPPGLSGLALDSAEALWAVSERGGLAVQLSSTGERVSQLTLPALDGVDAESLAWLSDGRLAIGGETDRRRDADQLFLLQVADGAAVVTTEVRLDYAPFGLRATSNKGIEALSAVGDVLVAGSEMVVEEGDTRDAPLWLQGLDGGAPTLARLRLSTATGKLSAIEAWQEDDALRLVALERHFGVARLLVVNDASAGGGLAPERVLDLWPLIEAMADEDTNLEGLVRLADGALLLISDNQYGDVGVAWMLTLPAGW